ncbi:hypothetical protein [Plantactinospora sp. GCM10030261]|uniref:hypothetical protein n=1 Tax=Plantactinospora sp. GCM10030261 TaxID=3273420 RepID=UPI0036132BD5
MHGFVVHGREGGAAHDSQWQLTGVALAALLGFPGLLLAGPLSTLLPNFPGELTARRLRAEWLAERGG